MSSKKVIMSVTASAAIASAFFGAHETEAASYKVQHGDTLWSIAQKCQTSVAHLKSLNHLTSDIILPNQILETGSNGVQQTTTGSSKQSATTSTSTYIVKSGDTLSKIALQHGISLSNLINWNHLSSSLIFPGDVLVVSNQGQTTSSNKNAESTTVNQEDEKKSGTTVTYTIKSGDTLSDIAFKYNVSIKDIMTWNNLNSTLIFTGQTLKVKNVSSSVQSSTGNNSNTNTSKNTNQTVTHSTTYSVKAGDSLWKIANSLGVTVQNLKIWNNLSSDNIYTGQKLTVKTAANNPSENSNSSQPTSSYNAEKVISVAKSFIGVPYVWGGITPSGFDCSGYIYYVYKQAGMDIKRYSAEGYYDRSYYVSNPQVGDLVFFKGTYKTGISHVGIYLGNNQFINAGSDGVEIASLSNSYWKKHFDSFKRFY